MNPPRPDMVTASREELLAYIKSLEIQLAEQQRKHQDAVDDLGTMLDDMGVTWGPLG